MIPERLLEMIAYQNMIRDINSDLYDKKAIMKRYLTLKREFLEPYRKDSSQK